MWKTAATGGVLLIAGAARLAEHINRAPTLQDYLAFRCGSDSQAFGPGTLDHTLLSIGHCWGCYAMALGAALLLFAALRATHPARKSARQAD